MNAIRPHRRDVLAATLGAIAASPARALIVAGGVDILMTTGQGAIALHLFTEQAPITSANFLDYLDRHLYDGGSIYRAMRLPPAAAGGSPTGLVQGGARPDAAGAIGPITHEPTTKTGLSHRNGTISLARLAPGTATSDFFICVGDAGYLDAHPDAAGDNLGFAAFGQVTRGMDVVHRILGLPTITLPDNPGMAGQMLSPPVPIVRIERAG